MKSNMDLVKKTHCNTTIAVFYDCTNMTEDDWQLLIVIFLDANTLGRNMTANMTASLFWVLYFTNIYYTPIGNTEVFHRECREHVWGTLSHISNHIFMGVTFFYIWVAQEKYGQSKKNMDKSLFKILKS